MKKLLTIKHLIEPVWVDVNAPSNEALIRNRPASLLGSHINLTNPSENQIASLKDLHNECVEENKLSRVLKTNNSFFLSGFGFEQSLKTHSLMAILTAMQILYRFNHYKKTNKNYPGNNIKLAVHSGVIDLRKNLPDPGISYVGNEEFLPLLRDMMEIAPPGCVIVSEKVKNACEYQFYFEEFGTFPMGTNHKVFPIYFLMELREVLKNPFRMAMKSKFNSILNQFAHQNFEKFIFNIQKNIYPAIDFLKMESMDGALLHSRAVAMFAVAFAKYLGLIDDIFQESDILFAALLHDCGKQNLNREILLKPFAEMNSYEKDKFLKLPRYSLDTINRCKINKESAVLIKLFYQFLRTKKNSIPYEISWTPTKGTEKETNLAKVIALADFYDSLTNPKSFRMDHSPKPPPDAIQFILKQWGDEALIQKFADFMG